MELKWNPNEDGDANSKNDANENGTLKCGEAKVKRKWNPKTAESEVERRSGTELGKMK